MELLLLFNINQLFMLIELQNIYLHVVETKLKTNSYFFTKGNNV